MITVVTKDIQTLTTRFAERLLTYNTFKGQRKLDAEWVGNLTNIIREDLFTVGHIAVVTYANGGKPIDYLVNGQHQCNGVVAANKPVKVVFEKYLCDTMDDVSLLYEQFDNHKTRSLQNLVTMKQDALGIIEWPSKIANLTVTGAAMKEGKFNASKHVKVSLLPEYLRHGKFLRKLLTDIPSGSWAKECAHLMRGPVVSAIFTTWEKSQSDSERFWIAVRDGEGLKRTEPQHKLRDFLKESNFDRGRGAVGGARRTVNQHEMTSRCITAWNAFRKGQSTDLKYFPGKPIPKAI